jgi:hypothetical protein
MKMNDKKKKTDVFLIGKKGKELWYPTYAPHIILGTNKSYLTEIYLKYPNLRIYK